MGSPEACGAGLCKASIESGPEGGREPREGVQRAGTGRGKTEEGSGLKVKSRQPAFNG